MLICRTNFWISSLRNLKRRTASYFVFPCTLVVHLCPWISKGERQQCNIFNHFFLWDYFSFRISKGERQLCCFKDDYCDVVRESQKRTAMIWAASYNLLASGIQNLKRRTAILRLQSLSFRRQPSLRISKGERQIFNWFWSFKNAQFCTESQKENGNKDIPARVLPMWNSRIPKGERQFC